MRQGESRGADGDSANKLASSIRPHRPVAQATIRLGGARDAVTLTKLRASLPVLEPITPVSITAPPTETTETSTVRAASSVRETPHAIVLPTTSHADRVTLTMLRGPGVGTTYTLSREETVLGRGTKADIILDEPSISREHARVAVDAEGAYVIEDLGSTNGTFVGGKPVKRAVLKSGDRVQLGSEYTFRFAILDAEEESLQRKLYESSSRDVLTGLTNRGTLFEHLGRAIERCRRDGGDLAVLIIDADHFKSVNDRFGHAAGDEVLKAIALAGSRVLGEGDVYARYGGEEFAILTRLAGSAAAAERDARTEAAELAESARAAVEELRVEVGAGAIGVTVSIGVALLSECQIVDGLELFARADARLYAAKLGGRNRVCASE